MTSSCSPSRLLSEAEKLGFKLHVGTDGKLHLSGNRPPPELVAEVKENRQELLVFLAPIEEDEREVISQLDYEDAAAVLLFRFVFGGRIESTTLDEATTPPF